MVANMHSFSCEVFVYPWPESIRVKCLYMHAWWSGARCRTYVHPVLNRITGYDYYGAYDYTSNLTATQAIIILKTVNRTSQHPDVTGTSDPI